MIGVNLISIYSVFCMYFCNLNARFTPVFLKITLIPHLLMFCRTRTKIKHSDGRNQVKMKLLSCSRLLIVVKPKKAKMKPRVHRSEG